MVSHSAIAAARTARRTGVVGLLPASSTAAGMARPAFLRAAGKDAPSFLHSQITNEVEALEPGQGNLAARVSRTGHLESLFSLHRELGAGDPSFVLLTEEALLDALHDTLDAFLFSDVVELTRVRDHHVLALQGPVAPALADALFGPVGFEPWDTLPEHAIRPLRRARAALGLTLPPGTFAIRRSLTGDAGFLVFVPPSEHWTPLAQAACEVAAEHGALELDPAAFAEVLEITRIEAGMARVGPETQHKRRLLPETGLEQYTVSYTKGCYLGQEVIARVRTYGSVPNLLRALRLLDATLDDLPALGEPVLVDGKRVGHFASRTWSPVLEAPVTLAFLGRSHRTPGQELVFEGLNGPVRAEVVLLPIYHAPDSAARVQALYDRAVRSFAKGQASSALTLLEDALRIDPGFADGYEAIGVILGKAGRFHEAIDFFRRLEEVAPDEPLVNTNLSLYYMKIGDKTTAEDEAGKATLKSMARHRGADAATVDADLQRSKRKDAERKTKMFSRVLEIDEIDPIALFGMGTAMLTLERFEEAADYLQRAIAADKSNSAVYVAHGRALEKLDRTADAVGVYRTGMEVASRKGDLMPLKEMEHRMLLLGAPRA